MKRVTGIGGIFFNAKDPATLRAWYKTHLGIDVQAWGGTAFTWADAAGNPYKGTTIWLIGAADGGHFAPSTAPFMINYRVDDLAGLLQALRDEGCNVLEKTDDSEYGKFAWVIDPEGNKADAMNRASTGARWLRRADAMNRAPTGARWLRRVDAMNRAPTGARWLRRADAMNRAPTGARCC